MNLSGSVKVLRLKPDGSGWTVAAGTTDVNSDVVDTANFDGCLFITAFGAIVAGAVTSVKIQQGAASNMSDAADLAGTAIAVADDDDNQIVIHDIYRPRERYLRATVDRGTQNATVDGQIAILYGPRVQPVTQDSTLVVSTEVHASPAEGTA